MPGLPSLYRMLLTVMGPLKQPYIALGESKAAKSEQLAGVEHEQHPIINLAEQDLRTGLMACTSTSPALLLMYQQRL